MSSTCVCFGAGMFVGWRPRPGMPLCTTCPHRSVDIMKAANTVLSVTRKEYPVPKIYDVAYAFAKAAHTGQKRKYSDTPYITHPVQVARLVTSASSCTDEMLAAAVLHDVVEDCGVQQATIDRIFGKKVGTLVHWLTVQTTLSMGNRAVRKAMDNARLALAPAEAQTIKVADLMHNCEDIVYNDPDFAITFVKEKRAVLNVLVNADPVLLGMAQRRLFAAEKLLGLR